MVYSLTVVAWPVAALSDVSTVAREARRADSRAPRKNALMLSLTCIRRSLFRVPRGETRWVTGPDLWPWRPPDPAAAGNNL